MNRALRALREDGLFLFSGRLLAFGQAWSRNRLLARSLHVKQLRIGPRATLRGLRYIKLGEDFSALEGLWLEAVGQYNEQHFSPSIVIGRHVRLSRFVHIAATHRVEIGDHVLMGSNVLITDHNHGQYAHLASGPEVPPALRDLDSDRTVMIGNNVWLGEAVVVMPGAHIGEGSVIAAHSVVSGEIPAFSIAAGAPATVRKQFNFESRQWSKTK